MKSSSKGLYTRMVSRERALKKKLKTQGNSDPTYNANEEFSRQNKYRTDDENLTREIFSQVLKGVVERYGEAQGATAPQQEIRRPEVTIEEHVYDQLNKKVNGPAPVPQEPEVTVEEKKNEVLQEVSGDS